MSLSLPQKIESRCELWIIFWEKLTTRSSASFAPVVETCWTQEKEFTSENFPSKAPTRNMKGYLKFLQGHYNGLLPTDESLWTCSSILSACFPPKIIFYSHSLNRVTRCSKRLKLAFFCFRRNPSYLALTNCQNSLWVVQVCAALEKFCWYSFDWAVRCSWKPPREPADLRKPDASSTSSPLQKKSAGGAPRDLIG